MSLSLVELIAANAEFAREIGRGLLSRVQQSKGFPLNSGLKSFRFFIEHLPGRCCPLVRCPSNPG
jgi:hypothetical protein